MKKKVKSCQCESCKDACLEKPGWFKPEQIKSLLKHFEAKTIRDLLGKNKLAIDWWDSDSGNILVLAPNVKGNNRIQYSPKDPRGECVFFKKEKCSIYKIRPFECRELRCNESYPKLQKRHKNVMKSWENSKILVRFKNKVKRESMSFLGGFSGLNLFNLGD